MKKQAVVTLALAGFGLLSGCTSYYKVTDPRTKNVYYTDGISRQPSGSVIPKDAKTSQEVTLDSSEIQTINKQQFEYGKTSPSPTTEPQ